MERVTATWPDGRRVTFWDGEVSGDLEVVRALDRQSSAEATTPDRISSWRRDGCAFMAASTAVLAPSLPTFESKGISLPDLGRPYDIDAPKIAAPQRRFQRAATAGERHTDAATQRTRITTGQR
jgi:hypothetical protein